MILLGLGSNLGDREQNIIKAIVSLANEPGITVQQVSSLYETEPVGYTDQPAFINAVIRIVTDRQPQDLLDACLAIEKDLGRVRDKRWGPRTLDIDILIYNDLHYYTEKLELPHPRIHERCFVLMPLNEIAPATCIQGKTPAQWLAQCETQVVAFYKKLNWHMEEKNFA